MGGEGEWGEREEKGRCTGCAVVVGGTPRRENKLTGVEGGDDGVGECRHGEQVGGGGDTERCTETDPRGMAAGVRAAKWAGEKSAGWAVMYLQGSPV
jgi:hypothetical protein